MKYITVVSRVGKTKRKQRLETLGSLITHDDDSYRSRLEILNWTQLADVTTVMKLTL